MEPSCDFLDSFDWDNFDWGDDDFDINALLEQPSSTFSIGLTNVNPRELTQPLPNNTAWAFPGSCPPFSDATSQPISSPIPCLDGFSPTDQSQALSATAFSDSSTSPSTDSQFSPVTDGSSWADPHRQPWWQTRASNMEPLATNEIRMDQLFLLSNSGTPSFSIPCQTNPKDLQHHAQSQSPTWAGTPREPSQPQYRTLRPANTQQARQALHSTPSEGTVKAKKKQKKEKKVKCEFCDKMFSDKRDRLRHYNVHPKEAERAGIDLPVYDCKRCRERLKSDWSRERHMKRKHSY
ncbi:hypothetical protein B0I35DRAFT_87061 [Stachybotrys elegans]|uniref:C2H2-type domain-containing protein n=1 Tax=Stachybotrys elegans TaxID=80388 RepID=A0A8K0SJK9_9HYPO|nr:hypothetical protein B0I35DRAFT_87061 [Stachybotrys elegans]